MNGLGNIVYIAPILCILGVMSHILPFWLIVLLFIAFLFTLNKHEAVIALAFSVQPIAGLLFYVMNIGVPGSLLTILLVFALVGREIRTLFLPQFKSSLLYIIVTIAVIVLFYYIGDPTPFSTKKITGVLLNTILSIIPLVILSHFEDIDTQKLAPIFMMQSVCMVSICITFLPYINVNSIFDFGFMRVYEGISYSNEKDLSNMISYQQMGNCVLIALGLYLSKLSKIENWKDCLILVSCMWLVLVSGSRQSIFGSVSLFVVWLMLRNGNLNVRNVIGSGILLFVLLFVLESLNIEALNDVFNNDADANSRLNRHYDYTFEVIQKNLLLGVGFGHYRNNLGISEEYYAHNIILEILSEMGIVGLVALVTPLLVFLHNKGNLLYMKLNCGALALFILLPHLLHAFISEDISKNIIVFMFIYIMYSKTKQTKSFIIR